MEQKCGPVVFLSDFDSGNLARAEYVEPIDDPDLEASSGKEDMPQKLVCDYEFNVWTKPDCMGTEFVNANRTWFYFGVKSGPSGKVIRINVMNLNKQSRLYSQGMVPVVKVSYGTKETLWERLKTRVIYQAVEGNFILSFTYKLPESRNAIVYFAFCFPFSYTDCQALLTNLEGKHSAGPFVKTLENMIYFHRELLCYSCEGRRIDLITITSCAGIARKREERICGLFPDASTDRPHRFHGKKVYFLTARVHPGETPSSFVFNGFIDFILNEKDPRAHILRQLFVFKLVPMINPDGVYNGFYRTDTRGVNLNRVYLNPDPCLHPSVYAIKSLLLYHHEKPDIIELPELRISNANGSGNARQHVDNLTSGLGDRNGSLLDQLSNCSAVSARPLSGENGDNLRQSRKEINTLSCNDTDACLSQPINRVVENLLVYGDNDRYPKRDITNLQKDFGEICRDTGNNEDAGCKNNIPQQQQKQQQQQQNNIPLNIRSSEEGTDNVFDVNSDVSKSLQLDFSSTGFLPSSTIYSDGDRVSNNEIRPLQCGNDINVVVNAENNNNCKDTNGYLLDLPQINQYFKQDYQVEVPKPFIDSAVGVPYVADSRTTGGLGGKDSSMISKSMDGGMYFNMVKSFESYNSKDLDLSTNGYTVVENSLPTSVYPLSETRWPVLGNGFQVESSVCKKVAYVGNSKRESADDFRTGLGHDKELSSDRMSNNTNACYENANGLNFGGAKSLKIERTFSSDLFTKDSGDSDIKNAPLVRKDSNVAYYIDLHGHASKRGCFIYANHMENYEDQIEALLFPKLMSINSQNFDFEACNFSLRNMTMKDKRDGMSKEGSGRVAIYKTTGLIHSYTLECNYNTGRIANPLPLAAHSNGRATPPMLSNLPPKYTPEVYAQVGRALAITALDVLGANPWSRIPASDFHTLKGIRQWLGVYIRSTHNPTQVPKRIARSKTKDDILARGSVVKKIEQPRSSRKFQTTTEKKPIPLAEHKMKDLSLESADSKTISVPQIESKPVSEKRKVSKQTLELRLSRIENKAPQEKKERNKSLPFLGLQQKPIEVVAIKEQNLATSQMLLNKEIACKYKLKTMPKVINKPVRKTFGKSIKSLQSKDIKKKEMRCEKTKI